MSSPGQPRMRSSLAVVAGSQTCCPAGCYFCRQNGLARLGSEFESGRRSGSRRHTPGLAGELRTAEQGLAVPIPASLVVATTSSAAETRAKVASLMAVRTRRALWPRSFRAMRRNGRICQVSARMGPVSALWPAAPGLGRGDRPQAVTCSKYLEHRHCCCRWAAPGPGPGRRWVTRLHLTQCFEHIERQGWLWRKVPDCLFISYPFIRWFVLH